MEEDFWKLKLRILWLNNEDANTKFFHISSLQRRYRNRITSLRDGVGNYITNEELIKIHIIDFYQSLYSTKITSSNCRFLIGNHPVVPPETASTLIAPLSRKEVVDTILSFKPLKAPGPNGLHLFFYQQYLNLVGDSVINLCNQIFTNFSIPDVINNTYLCLIPKFLELPQSLSFNL